MISANSNNTSDTTSVDLMSSARVLVVDDSKLIRMGVFRALRLIGITQIDEASNGREALSMITTGNFDLMLLDIEMPEMSGIQVLQEMHSQDLTRSTHVIVISGGHDSEDAVKCIELGAEDYLPKPFNPVLLRARLSNTLEKKRLRDLDKQRLQTKSDFLALMSHELRTPMAGVIGILGLVLRDQISPSVREKISLAQKNASSLLAIVNDLLDVSKIEAGKFNLENIDFELLVILEDALSLQSERTNQKNIYLNLDVDSTLPPYLIGDPTRLRQVLINLVGNAIKFTDSGGVTVKVSSLSEATDQVLLHFEVIDTGIGMKPEALGRMFQKFEQADTSTSRKFGGTGLGLAICKQLVELMGGTIGVTSTFGSGSTFWFKLSLHIGQKPQSELAVEIKSHSRPLSVLVAEDVQTNQIIIRAILEEMGHQVTVVDHGQLALKALCDQSFDVVLMDGRMPIMDGLEASRHIRLGHWSDENGQLWKVKNPKVHIIALTANATEQDRAQFIDVGMNEFLTKPVQEPLLFEALQRVIDELPDLTSLDALLAPLPQGHATNTTPNPVAEITPPPGKSSLQEKMWCAFKEQAPLNLNEIEQAIAQDDWNTAAIKVHGIKGSVSYIWPESNAYHLAAKLEKHADAKETQEFKSGFVQLKTQLQELLS
jgi:signal transduction histidine kinase/HPt (histidine-containing phosphotransfer) domain-containing protein